MFWFFIKLTTQLFIFFYVLYDLILAIRDRKYQKKWDKEKAMLVRVDPAITRAELCEQYVMFCKRNNCKVDY